MVTYDDIRLKGTDSRTTKAATVVYYIK